jgi:hypothetical protein
MQVSGSRFGKPTFRGSRGDGLVFANLGPNVRSILCVLRMVLRDRAVWQEPPGRPQQVPTHDAPECQIGADWIPRNDYHFMIY